MAYTKLSNEKFQNSNLSTFENNIPSISSTANQEFCIPCKGNGNTYTDVDGKSVQCNTIAKYLLTTDGKNALITAMEKIDNTNTFNFNINGNAYNTKESELNVNSAVTAGSAKELSNGQCGIFVNQNNGNPFMVAQCGPGQCWKDGTSMLLGSTDVTANTLPIASNCIKDVQNSWNAGVPFMNNKGGCNYCT